MRLELAEGADQLGAEHLRQQLAARLAVAVLAGERAAVAHDEVRGLVEKRAELARCPAGVTRSKLVRVWTQPSPKWP